MADDKLHQLVNLKMCSGECPCEGDEQSVPYLAYKKHKEPEWNTYGRTKTNDDSWIQMTWGRTGFKSMLGCLDKGKTVKAAADDPSTQLTKNVNIGWVKDALNAFNEDGSQPITSANMKALEAVLNP